MRVLVSYLILILLAGCADSVERGASIEEVKTPVTDPEFIPHKTRFYGLYESQTLDGGLPDVLIVFGVLEGQYGAVGYCDLVNGKPRITIVRDAWERFSEKTREQLIFHEMGHCLLNRTHDSETFEDGRPKSIMFHRLFSDRIYNEFYEYYIRELMTGLR